MKSPTENLVMAIVMLLIGLQIAVAQGVRKPIPFSFSIASADEIKAGSQVIVHITTTNTSDSTVGLEVMEVSPYIAIVRGADGILSPETAQGRKIKEKQKNHLDPNFTGGRQSVHLEPGKSITEECTVSDLYDMSQPGRYTIQLERIWGRNVVPSNTVTVNIVK